MSQAQRHRRRSQSPDWAGQQFFGPNPRLPQAKLRVETATEDEALRGWLGVWGDTPRAAATVYAPPGGARYGQKGPGNYPPAERLYGQLRQLQYRLPARTLVCQQRAVRREVLFARNVAGFSGRSPGRRGRYFRRQESQYGC